MLFSISKQCFLLIVFVLATTQVSADVSISGLDDITINAWSGVSNNLEGSDTYCTLSCNNNCRRPRHYDVAAYTSGPTDGAGNFYLTHTGDGSTTLRVFLDWTNPVVGTFTLTNYSVTGYTAPPSSPFAPGATNCGDPNSQNTITMRVAEADLASALAGTYAGTLQIDVCRLNGSGTSTLECLVPVSFSVTLPELIQITQLQDFNLGVWSGLGAAQSSDDFCVFRNGYGGFSITAAGSNDAGGSFRLGSGSNFVPFSVEFGSGGAWHPVSPSTTLSSSLTGFAGDSTRNCGGGTTHSMRVTVQESDLNNADVGSYSDVITVLVQPE